MHSKFWGNQTAAQNVLLEKGCQDLGSEDFLRAITWEPVDFNLYIKLVNKAHVALRNQKY